MSNHNTIYKIRRKSDGKLISTTKWTYSFTNGAGRVFKRLCDLHQYLILHKGAKQLEDCEIVQYVYEENDVLDLVQYTEMIDLEQSAKKQAKLDAIRQQSLREQEARDRAVLAALKAKYPNA